MTQTLQGRSLADTTLICDQSEHHQWGDTLNVCAILWNTENTWHSFCAVPAKDAEPEANQKETPDKPTLREGLRNKFL